MVKKAALAAALLAVLVTLATATATTYTTTVTTTTIDDEANRGQQQQCRQQLQGRQFRPCQRYLSQRGGSSQYGGDEEVLEMITENPQQQSEYLRDCCQQLQNVNQQCRCEAIKQAVRQVQQQGTGQQTGQSQQVYEKARSLPRQCNFRGQQCQFHVVFV